MYKIGDKIAYRNEICTVINIDKKYKEGADYYALSCENDPSLLIHVPVEKSEESLRLLLTKTQIEELLNKAPEIPVIEITAWNRGAEYRELLSRGSHENIISVIKTAYLRQQEKIKKQQKVNEGDKVFFRQTERILYNEIAASLDITYDEAKKYVIDKLS